MTDPTSQKEQMLNLLEEGFSPEQLDTQVQKAQEQLSQLKRQQELIEKQKRELEELSRRQDQLHNGQVEMVEKFTRALVVIERETMEAQKRVDQLADIRESYTQHLNLLEGIDPKSWDSLEINKELNKALSAVDDARAEYGKSFSKISPEIPPDAIEGSDGYPLSYDALQEKNFFYWLKSGFAFTLPLLILGVVALVVYLATSTNP